MDEMARSCGRRALVNVCVSTRSCALDFLLPKTNQERESQRNIAFQGVFCAVPCCIFGVVGLEKGFERISDVVKAN